MSDIALIEAVDHQHLVHWLDRGFLRTLEPHLFVRIGGNRDVLIAFQVAGGPSLEDQQGWKLIDSSEPITVAVNARFAGRREVPEHLQELVRATYAPVPAGERPRDGTSSFAEPRR